MKLKNKSKCINDHELKFINSEDEYKQLLCISCDKKFVSLWNCHLCNFNICINCSIKPEKGLCPNKHLLIQGFNHNDKEIFCDICCHVIITNSIWSCKTCSFNVCNKCGPEQLGLILNQCPMKHNLKIKYVNNSYSFCSKCSAKSKIVWNCSSCDFNICLQCGPVVINGNRLCPYGEKLKWTSHKDRKNEDFNYCSSCRLINYSSSWRCENCLFNYCIDCGPKLNILKLTCDKKHPLKFVSPFERVSLSDSYIYNCSVCKKSQREGSLNCLQCNFYVCGICKIIIEDINK